MNILPHKSWHVRTRKNITRVREDEKKAAKEEADRIQRIKLAEQEAKINLLRQRARSNKISTEQKDLKKQSSGISASPIKEHVNFFQEVESGKYLSKEENQERIKEKKEEREKYEKQVGFLTYLGQDTNEILNKRDWYDVAPLRESEDKFDERGKKIEVALKSKIADDPFTLFRKYTTSSFVSDTTKIQGEALKSETSYKSVLCDESCKKRRHSKSSSSNAKIHKSSKRKHEKKKKHSKSKKSKKKHKKSRHSSISTSDSDDTEIIELRKKKLEILRLERLERERIERERAERFLAMKSNQPTSVAIKQTYNNQFMPDLARQNQ